MSGDVCPRKELIFGAHVQENGIIRNGDGRYLGRMEDDYTYEDLPDPTSNTADIKKMAVQEFIGKLATVAMDERKQMNLPSWVFNNWEEICDSRSITPKEVGITLAQDTHKVKAPEDVHIHMHDMFPDLELKAGTMIRITVEQVKG